MLSSMRRNTKIIMLVVAIAFVGLMVFEWGMDMSGRSSPGAGAVGEVGSVNGTTISYQVWTRAFRTFTDQARQQKGSALNDLEIDYIEEQTWNELIREILIDQEIDRLGIKVTDDEVRMAFQTSPPPWLVNNELFQTDGQFDFGKYQAYFSSPAVDPLLLSQIEQYYRDILPRVRLYEEVGSGIYVADSELWHIYRDRSEQVQVSYVIFDPETQIEDSEVSVPDGELLSYYEENREDFRQPATAMVTVVELTRAAEASDTAAALERARNLRQEAVDGADFVELASANSADAGSAAQGGDLGWFGRGDMTPPFEAAAFELEPGQISEPVLTDYGYHIIKVAEKEDDRVRASHILLRIEMAGGSEDRLLTMVDRLERVALKNGLDAAIDSVGTAGRQVTLTEGSDFVPGIGPFSPATGWAFHDSTFAGDVSPVYETDQGFHVFELVQRAPESYLTFADAEASVRRRLLSEKKIETSRWQAEQIAVEFASGSSLEEVAAAHGMDVQTTDLFSRLDFVPGLGQYNKVIGAAFGSEPGKTSGPFESDGRLYFLHVVNRVEANREAFDAGKETLRAQLTMQRRESAVNEWLSDLREQAEIQDWRRQAFVPRS